MNRHAGVHRAFDLSVWAYFLDFALVPIAVLALVAFAISDASWHSVMAAIGAGLLAWSLAEYWIHRLVFHGRTPFQLMHQQHHALPKDMIGVASWGTFSGFAMVFAALAMMTGPALAAATTAGVMGGYFFYCAIHVAMHHAGAFGFGRYGRMMLRRHNAHHRGGKGNFGVTSPLWDIVFRTSQPL